MAKEITTANFETEVLKSEKPVLIDFWATWCGPCMRQGPVVEELAEEGYAVGKVDVDQNMALAQQFRVVSIPTLILFFFISSRITSLTILSLKCSPCSIFFSVVSIDVFSSLLPFGNFRFPIN